MKVNIHLIDNITLVPENGAEKALIEFWHTHKKLRINSDCCDEKLTIQFNPPE